MKEKETAEVIDKKITAQDLIMYIGLPCAITEDGIEPVSAYIEGVDVSLNKVIAERINYEPKRIKPILKSLEDLTVEDTVFISCDILEYERSKYSEAQKKWNENDINDIKKFGFIQFSKDDMIFMPKVVEYLIRKGYDLNLLPQGTYFVTKQGKIVK